MRSPRPADPFARRLLAILATVSLLTAIPLLAVADDGLKEARQELKETKAQIRERAARMRALQRHMNQLATQISRNEATIARAEARIRKLEGRIRVLEARTAILEERLAERTREAYIMGPGVPIVYLLTATSAAEAVSRLSFLDEMSRRDGLLAEKVGRNRDHLESAKGEMVRARSARVLAAQQMEAARDELRAKMAESRRLFAQLQGHKREVLDTISRIRPFAVCPVAGPHAISDSFGIWVHHPKDEGGDHIHQGNDIMAPTGTPIVAPFDGTAVSATNKIGGLAVKVFGDYGYVYNAHLSSFGRLGPVQRGDVVGYVGSTGNAGGPHDHFEWHPGNGPAVDPNAFLLQVC